jgi:hypothetical protein
MATAGVDGAIELIAELDRRSDTSSIALKAPRSPALYRYLAEGMAPGPHSAKFTRLTIELIEHLGIWWSRQTYASLPVMVPWCIRDRTCRYDQGPESWGSPRSDGYLRDDNSIIKKLPLPLLISGPEGSAYQGRKPWRGFTACHIWRDLPSGELAGADPWLYSFVPNLIWLPSWLAPLTDRQGSDVQAILQRTSIALFRDVRVHERLSEYSELAWDELPPPPPGAVLSAQRLSKFDPNQSFFTRRLQYLDKFVQGCDDVLAGRPLSRKLICTRYTEALPTLDHAAIRQFRNTIDAYRNAGRAALIGG